MTTRIDRDGPLVAALRRHDPTAAEDLVAAYGNRACHLARRITGSAQDAEEAVQDAFLSVIGKIDTFREESEFGSWLCRIVANAAYQRCRSRRVRSGDVSLNQLLPVFDEHGRHVAPVTDWSMSVDDPARQTELRMVLSTAIDELPADYRAIVLLRDVEGLSQQEAAEALGLTVVNVKTRLHRARLFLRKRLEARLAVSGRSVRRPDSDRRRVFLDSVDREGVALEYDYLILAAGASHSYFGHDEFARFAPGLKSLADAVSIRNQILRAFEQAEAEEDPKRHGDLLTFVLVGAGPTGVEMAGALAVLVRSTLRSEFRRVDPTSARIVLID